MININSFKEYFELRCYLDLVDSFMYDEYLDDESKKILQEIKVACIEYEKNNINTNSLKLQIPNFEIKGKL